MRRKSGRNATKKQQNSPEKTVEKEVKKRRSRRRKQSTSSENESGGEEVASIPQPQVEVTVVQPKTPVKEDPPAESQEQVWQVRTSESAQDSGEIKKLKICLTRPPSTPERVDRSPRSKRKHSRTTSSSDTGDGEEKKRKHKSKRSSRESKDDMGKNESSQEEPEIIQQEVVASEDSTVSQSTETVSKQSTVPESASSTAEEAEEKITQSTEASGDDKYDEPTPVISQESPTKEDHVDSTETVNEEISDVNNTDNNSVDIHDVTMEVKQPIPNSSGKNSDKANIEQTAATEKKEELNKKKSKDHYTSKDKVSIQEKTDIPKKTAPSESEVADASNKTDVVEPKSQDSEGSVNQSVDKPTNEVQSKDEERHRALERSDSHQSNEEENKTNGPSTPIVINRKRRWGKIKLNSQSSITISTDVLKDIIPDVKPTELEEVIEQKKKHKRIEVREVEVLERPVLPKIVINNTDHVEPRPEIDDVRNSRKESVTMSNRRISVVKDDNTVIRPPSPPRNEPSCILYITNLVRPFTLPQLKNLLQRTGRIVEDGFWIDKIKSRCFVKYENEDEAIETRHALHGVTWPPSNPKTLQVDFSSDEKFEMAKSNENTDNTQTSNIPSTVEDWLREQDAKKERGEPQEKPWERKSTREWDVGKGEKEKDDKIRRERDGDRPGDRLGDRRRRQSDHSPEPARKFKKKEEEAPAKLLDDLFRKTKTTPCIYWLPLAAETIAVKEEQRRLQLLEHERRIAEMRRRRH